MTVERIGVHTSVERVFPPAELRRTLAGDPVTDGVAVDVVDGERPSVDALVTLEYHPGFLDAAPEWIHSIQSGTDRFPYDRLAAHGVALTSSRGIHRDWIGETVAGYLLSFARGLHRFARHQARGEWIRLPWNRPFTVAGERLCVVGLGALGRGIAERAAGLDVRVTGVKRTPEPVEHVETVHPADRLHDAIADARFVALAVPLTDDTEGLIGRPELERMREDAYLINVARGGVVEEDALVTALEEGAIAGAALDVFDTEPLPPESPLWDLDEVIVTPHSAGLSVAYADAVAAIVRENLAALRSGDDLRNRVVR